MKRYPSQAPARMAGYRRAYYERQLSDPEKAAALKVRNSAATMRLISRKQRMLASFKLTVGCTDCGFSGHPAALDFDHVHADKTYKGNFTSMGYERMWTEALEACEVRCANCHRIRHNTGETADA